MGYFLGRGSPIAPVVTRKEYLDAVDRAFDALSREQRWAAHGRDLDALVAGRPGRAAALSSLLKERGDDPTLHHLLGISYLRAGRARLAVRHFEIALALLARAIGPTISLVCSLRIELEASLVRLALATAHERLGHRASAARCLLAQNRPLSWDVHSGSTRPS